MSVLTCLQLVVSRARRPGIQRLITNIHSLAHRALRNLHRLTIGLRPPLLSSLNLIMTVRGCLSACHRARPKLAIAFRRSKSVSHISQPITLFYCHVIRRKLAGVTHRTRTRAIAVKLRILPSGLALSIHSSNVNFDTSQTRQTHLSGRLKLIDVHRQASMLGKAFTVSDRPNGKAALAVSLPLCLDRRRRRRRSLN